MCLVHELCGLLSMSNSNSEACLAALKQNAQIPPIVIS